VRLSAFTKSTKARCQNTNKIILRRHFNATIGMGFEKAGYAVWQYEVFNGGRNIEAQRAAIAFCVVNTVPQSRLRHH
jgi:hypothetical protein